MLMIWLGVESLKRTLRDTLPLTWNGASLMSPKTPDYTTQPYALTPWEAFIIFQRLSSDGPGYRSDCMGLLQQHLNPNTSTWYWRFPETI